MTVSSTTALLHPSVGARVRYDGKLYQIIAIIDANRVLARNLTTFEIEHLVADRMQLARNEDELPPVAPIDTTVHHEPETVAIARKRLAVIEPLLKNAARTPETFQRIATEHKVGVSTIYNWLRRYNSGEHLMGLIPHRGGRKTGSKYLQEEQEKILETTIQEFYLQPQRPTAAALIEEVLRRCRIGKIDPPHGNTIRKRIHALDDKTALKRRGFRDKAHDTYERFQGGDSPDGKFPLEVVQIDHTRCDIEIVDSVTFKTIGRPWITVAIDTYSRMVTGLYLSLDAPSVMSVGMCISHSMCRKVEYLIRQEVTGEWPVWGPMAAIHVDNGSEFHSESLKDSLAKYKINLYWRGRNKKEWGCFVERMMKHIANFLRQMPGATFSNPAERKGYDSSERAALTLPELEKLVVDYIVNNYHRSYHSGIGMTPVNKLIMGITGTPDKPGTGLLPMFDFEDQVRIDFLPLEKRTVQQYGIQIDGITYNDPILSRFIGARDPKKRSQKRQFTIRRDPRNLSKIYLLDPQTNTYLTIPYAHRNFGPVNLSEWNWVKRHMREEGQRGVGEEAKFAELQRRQATIGHAQERTKVARREAERKRLIAKSLQTEDTQRTASAPSITVTPVTPPTATPPQVDGANTAATPSPQAVGVVAAPKPRRVLVPIPNIRL